MHIYIYMGKELKYRPGLKSEKGTAINLDETSCQSTQSLPGFVTSFLVRNLKTCLI